MQTHKRAVAGQGEVLIAIILVLLLDAVLEGLALT